MNTIAAQISATLHVFGQNLAARRDERGQTTAEYVGIVAFVALLVVAVIAFAPDFADKVKEIINKAFDKVGEKL